jgi:hypothetical protein
MLYNSIMESLYGGKSASKFNLAIFSIIIAAVAYFGISATNAAGGDINGDSKVDILDLSIMLSNWGKPGNSDLNNDGTTSVLDLSVLLSSYGQTVTSTGITAISASKFTNSVCVNTHLHYTDSPYYLQWPQVRDAVTTAGIHHVRDSQLDGSVWPYSIVTPRWQEFSNLGVKATLGPYYSGADIPRMVGFAAQNPAVEAIEGANELDQTGTGWQTTLFNTQKSIWDATRTQPNLVNRPVLVGSLAFSARWSQVAQDLTPYFTTGNIHSYPGGNPPSSNLAAMFSATSSHFGGKPMQSTETGYHNAVKAPSTESHLPTSERAQGIYTPQEYLEYFRQGIERTCNYEFIDRKANATLDNRELHFGLLRNDLTPKPAYTSLQRLMALVGDQTAVATPGKLDYKATGPTTLRQVLLQKSDGSYWIALWNDVSVWDPVNRVDLFPAEASVNITLSKAWSAYDLRTGTSPVRSGTGSFTLNVSPSPMLIKVQ